MLLTGFLDRLGMTGKKCEISGLSAVNKRRDVSIEALCRGVVEEVQGFSASKEFTDDVCLVAMKVDRLAPK